MDCYMAHKKKRKKKNFCWWLACVWVAKRNGTICGKCVTIDLWCVVGLCWLTRWLHWLRMSAGAMEICPWRGPLTILASLLHSFLLTEHRNVPRALSKQKFESGSCKIAPKTRAGFLACLFNGYWTFKWPKSNARKKMCVREWLKGLANLSGLLVCHSSGCWGFLNDPRALIQQKIVSWGC